LHLYDILVILCVMSTLIIFLFGNAFVTVINSSLIIENDIQPYSPPILVGSNKAIGIVVRRPCLNAKIIQRILSWKLSPEHYRIIYNAITAAYSKTNKYKGPENKRIKKSKRKVKFVNLTEAIERGGRYSIFTVIITNSATKNPMLINFTHLLFITV